MHSTERGGIGMRSARVQGSRDGELKRGRHAPKASAGAQVDHDATAIRDRRERVVRLAVELETLAEHTAQQDMRRVEALSRGVSGADRRARKRDDTHDAPACRQAVCNWAGRPCCYHENGKGGRRVCQSSSQTRPSPG
jgi:hypothetical protein